MDYTECATINPLIPDALIGDDVLAALKLYGIDAIKESGETFLFAEDAIASNPSVDGDKERELLKPFGVGEEDDAGWIAILQHVIRRSKGRLPSLQVAISLGASRMVPDACGGVGMFITGRGFQSTTISTWLHAKEKARLARTKRGGRRRKRR